MASTKQDAPVKEYWPETTRVRLYLAGPLHPRTEKEDLKYRRIADDLERQHHEPMFAPTVLDHAVKCKQIHLQFRNDLRNWMEPDSDLEEKPVHPFDLDLDRFKKLSAAVKDAASGAALLNIHDFYYPDRPFAMSGFNYEGSQESGCLAPSPDVADWMLERAEKWASRGNVKPKRRLTDEEVKLVGKLRPPPDSQSAKELAEAMGTSEPTVREHVHDIRRDFGKKAIMSGKNRRGYCLGTLEA